jgi:hypothetical protein
MQVDPTLPIRIFYANLLYLGITLQVDEGMLKISGATKTLSPAYREEIVKRKTQLVELLACQPPDALRPFCFRLCSLAEAQAAQAIAHQLRQPIRCTPVNGGWLVEMRSDG